MIDLNPMVARLLLVRHAETEYNVRGLGNGDPAVRVGLTATGLEQAERLRDRLAGEPIDLCVTTSFGRTKHTADIALAGRDVPRLVEPGLDDPPLGVFESKPLDDYLAWLHAHDWHARPDGGGESQLDTVRRLVGAYERLLRREELLVLVVGHNFPLGVARTLACEPPPAVRPHYDCDLEPARPEEIDPDALTTGVRRARAELEAIGRS